MTIISFGNCMQLSWLWVVPIHFWHSLLSKQLFLVICVTDAVSTLPSMQSLQLYLFYYYSTPTQISLLISGIISQLLQLLHSMLSAHFVPWSKVTYLLPITANLYILPIDSHPTIYLTTVITVIISWYWFSVYFKEEQWFHSLEFLHGLILTKALVLSDL